MEFKVGHLILCKNTMLRVISSGESHIGVIEYFNGLTIDSDVVIKTYSKQDNTWYRWTANGGEAVTLKKIGVIDPSKVPAAVRDFSQLNGFDTIIIKGVPYKFVDSEASKGITNYLLKNKNGEATLSVKEQKRETLYDKGATAELITSAGTTQIIETDVWIIVKH